MAGRACPRGNVSDPDRNLLQGTRVSDRGAGSPRARSVAIVNLRSQNPEKKRLSLTPQGIAP